MAVHPRLSVNQSSSGDSSLDDDLAFFERAGIRRVGLAMRKLDHLDQAGLEALRTRLDDVGVTVTSLSTVGPFTLHDPEQWGGQREALSRFMDAALVLRPAVCALTTGPAGPLSWETAADAFHDAMEGTIAEAGREDLFLCLEHTDSLRADLGFVHTLRDALDLGWRCDMGVCLDIGAAAGERNLAGLVEANLVAIGVVRVSDRRADSRSTPDRLVPGDGDLPLTRVLRHLHEVGYPGVFELDLPGPAVAEEGHEVAITRAIEHLAVLLDDLDGGSQTAAPTSG